MDELSLRFYDTLLNMELWQKSYERVLVAEKFSGATIDEIYSYMQNEKQRQSLAKKLCTGRYNFSTPSKISIAKEGTMKKRVVYCYEEFDRFVISLLYRAMNVVFRDKIPASCYSYKQGISTVDAIRELKVVKQNRDLYGVKMDIHAYFNSVSKEHLYRCIDELTPTLTGIGRTIAQLYKNDNILVKGVSQIEYKALIPGVALGSFWANYCLRDVDLHFEALGIPYARYSDDIILFDETKEKTQEHINYILTEIEKIGLTINPDKYTYFAPDEPVEYLGLRLTKDSIDISKHAEQKVKKTIKRWCRKARVRIERDGADFEKEARSIIKRFNYRLYKSYVMDTTKYGWAYYAFRYITTKSTLRALDIYCKDTLRAMKTGKHTKGNKYAITEEQFAELGYVSFVEMYELFRGDFGYYCDTVARL